MMSKKFIENNITIFYNMIDKLVNEYNNKYHRTIKITPVEASKEINEKKNKKKFIILKKQIKLLNLKLEIVLEFL